MLGHWLHFDFDTQLEMEIADWLELIEITAELAKQ